MNKKQFFGRCVGMEVKINLTSENAKHDYGEWQVEPYHRPHIICGVIGDDVIFAGDEENSFSMDYCQIIGRRIKDMTDEESLQAREIFERIYKTIHNKIIKIYQDGSELFGYVNELTDYLYSISVFPDKYFDELKWCVEEK